jgi:hypothetical protein
MCRNHIGGRVGLINTISWNTECGVLLEGTGTKENRVEGNYIGTDRGKAEDLRKGENGICIANLSVYSNKTHICGNEIRWNKENGVGIWCSNDNDIRGNTIWYNCRATNMVNSYTFYRSNNVRNNTCTSTGIHLDNSGGEFIGNTIEGGERDAIKCENGFNPIINWNNISGNKGFGLNNLDPSVTIDARNNW